MSIHMEFGSPNQGLLILCRFSYQANAYQPLKFVETWKSAGPELKKIRMGCQKFTTPTSRAVLGEGVTGKIPCC